MRHMLVAAVLLLAFATLARADRVIGSAQVQDRVVVEDVQREADGMHGRVVNRSPDVVTDVRILATDAFLWNNERHPGEDDPGQAATVTVPGPIPPGTGVPMVVPMAPRPPRSDGRFAPSASVVEFTFTAPTPGP